MKEQRGGGGDTDGQKVGDERIGERRKPTDQQETPPVLPSDTQGYPGGNEDGNSITNSSRVVWPKASHRRASRISCVVTTVKVVRMGTAKK
jgi:hypothetical protein